MSCSGRLKKGRFGYQWQAALALDVPIYDTSIKSIILLSGGQEKILLLLLFYFFTVIQSLSCEMNVFSLHTCLATTIGVAKITKDTQLALV